MSYRRFRGSNPRVMACLFTLVGIALFSVATVHAAPQYDLNCATCHGMPPLDSESGYRDPETGSFKGNHQTHADSTAASCVKCHGSEITTTGHRNKAINLQPNINGSQGGSYSRGVFFNQTSVPPVVLGTCSNVNCHSNGKGKLSTTPAWGSAKFTAPGSCSQCHDAAPATGNHPVDGTKHAAYFGTGTDSCAKCHNDHTAEIKPFAHATSAGRRNIDVKFVGGGFYTGSQSNQCSNLYCHSNGQSGAARIYAAPAWGGTLTCAGCHGDASGASALSGSHATHLTKSGITCEKCHYVTASGSSAIKAGSTTHVDSIIDVKFAGNGSYQTKKCSNLYCHSNGQSGTAISYASPTWGGTLTCAGCHGDASVSGAALLSGSHAKHLAKSGITCEDCHNATANGSFAIKTAAITHVNSEVNVGGGIVTYPATSGVKNCATICHNGTSPTWGNPGDGTVCGTCHSVGTPFSNNFKQYHVDNPALHNVHFGGNNVAYGPNITVGTDGSGCATCHAFTNINGGNHDNQVINLDTSKVNVTVGLATLPKGNSGITAKCSTCHTQAAVWKSSASAGGSRLSCESCHSTSGGALSIIGGKNAPDKTSAAATGHGKAGIAQGCTVCHDSSSSHIGVSGGTKRLLSNYSSSTAGAGCNNCHDSSVVSSADKKNMKVHRSSGLGSSCSDCHNVHGTGNSMMVNGTINGTAVSYSGTSTFANDSQTGVCQTCHTSTQYFTNAGTTSKTHVDSTTNCLGCHKHNPGSSGDLAFTVNGACDACHGYPPTPRVAKDAISFGIQGSWSSARFEDYSGGGGAHLVAAHIAKGAKPSDKWSNCTPCHSGGAATHARAMPIRQNIENVKVSVDSQYRFDNSFIVYTGARLVSPPAHNSVGSCSNTSCHMGQSPLWTTQGAMTCSSCHQMPPLDSTTGKNNPATRAVPGSHQKHANANVSSCVTCHGDQVTTYSTSHRNKAIELTDTLGYSRKSAGVFFNRTSVPPATLGTCSNATCHSNPYGAGTITTPVWGVTGSGCSVCHTVPIGVNGPDTGSHTSHAGVACVSCHAAGTTATTAPVTGHIDGKINIKYSYPETSKHSAGSYAGNCSNSCHGTTSPFWGNNTVSQYNVCTNCHGTPTETVTAANKYVIAPTDSSASDTGKVSAIAKTGAHQTHLRYFNGLSQQGADIEARCIVCHSPSLPTSATHSDGSSIPSFQGLATTSAGGTYPVSYDSGTCSVYCHNPSGTNGTLKAANSGTGTTPLWTDAAYIADGALKTETNCNRCHKSPGNPSFTAALTHDAYVTPNGLASDCSGCHGHNGGTGGAEGQQHMDGRFFGSGPCDSCHGYPPMSQAQLDARVSGTFTNAKLENYTSGGGYHVSHLLPTLTSGSGFAPCLPCHPSSLHNQGSGTVLRANVNVNDPADTGYLFDSARTKRYNSETMSCSNVSCHFKPSPSWKPAI